MAPVELVQAGQPLHPAVVGQRPPRPPGVGQGDGERGGDGDVPLLRRADVGAVVVGIVDPPDRGARTSRPPFDHARGRRPRWRSTQPEQSDPDERIRRTAPARHGLGPIPIR